MSGTLGSKSETYPQNPQELLEAFESCLKYIQGTSIVVDLLKGKWKLQILCVMREGPVRLSQLLRILPAASKKALRASLRELEAARVVIRTDKSGALLHVEYDFAQGMKHIMCSLLDHLVEWGKLIRDQQ